MAKKNAKPNKPENAKRPPIMPGDNQVITITLGRDAQGDWSWAVTIAGEDGCYADGYDYRHQTPDNIYERILDGAAEAVWSVLGLDDE